MNSEKITVAVVDGGGRGHALVEGYAKSPHVERILVFPGNDFMTNSEKPIVPYETLKTTDVLEIVRICQEEQKNRTVLVDVAQDAAVASGLANATRGAGLLTVGPSREAGRIEWDKVWSREFMKRVGVPQPEFHTFNAPRDGKDFLANHPNKRWFVKASGLAEGKGALPANSNTQALSRIDQLTKFKDAGETYLLEEWLEGDNGEPGEEFSAFAYSDGKTWQLVGYAQDHKRAIDGDKGENTGGMGCSTPPHIVDKDIDTQTREIFSGIFEGLKSEGTPYQGILYFGGMVVKRKGESKVYAIECNARWGDPEAEVLVPGIINDFLELNMAVAKGQLDEINIQTDGKTRVSVVVASKGYPGDYSEVKGKIITGLEDAQNLPGINVYGAGLRRNNDDFVVSGGRIVHIVAEGSTTMEANSLANSAADVIRVEEENGDNLAYHRRDIGYRDFNRQ